MTARTWYRHIDAAIWRATAGTAEVLPRQWPALDGGVESWRTWIRQVWACDDVADAVTVASPVLAGRVEAALGGSEMDAAQTRRMAMSLARYLVRMRSRATPFGLFAGVAPVRFGTPTTSRFTDGHQQRTRADGTWLAATIARLESSATLRRRLRVVVNDLAMVRGDRLFVLWQPHACDPEHPRPVEVSMRHTPPVALALQAARSPIRVADLIDKMTAEFPEADASAVDATVAELISRGVLITNLRPPLTVADGLGHLLEELRDVDAAVAPEVAPLMDELRAIHAAIQARGHLQHTVAARPRPALADRMRSLSAAAVQPLAVDLRLECTPVLPPQVAAEAAAAAGALLRLSAAPTGTPPWREYHARFLDRHGAGALVAVRQLVDPAAGLGFPDHYADPDRAGQPAQWSRRDERLLALAQRAALDGVQEVVLDEDAIDVLAGEETGRLRPAPHLDLSVEVRAPTTTALDAGDFVVVVTGIGRSAVATSGRFLEVLPDQDRRRIVDQYAGLPTGVDGALCAQVSFPPRHTRLENVTRVRPVLPAVISLGEHRSGQADHIPVSDLAVTADLDRMYVVSLSRRRVVEPVLTCAAAWHTMPPLARLLVETPHATGAPVALFDWGAAACLPFRPRLRYGRTVLSPARWQIPAGALPGPAAPQAEWEEAVGVLRRRLRLPGSVLVGTADRRLRLRLDDPMDLTLLRAHLDQASGPVVVTEAPAAADHGWCDGRAHEVVIPLASTAPPARPPAVVNRFGPLPLMSREHGYMPGSSVLSAKLYGPADAFDAILTDHLPALLSRWPQPPQWWFVRYRDPAPHLRIRIPTIDYGRDAARLGTWAADLRRCGLIGDLALDTYRPETARYGTGAAMTAAEALFAADSAAAVAQLAATTRRQAEPDALTAVSLVDLLGALLGSRPAGFGWLIDHADLIPKTMIRDRTVLRQAVALAALDTDSPRLPHISHAAEIETAWAIRRRAASAYADCLTDEAGITPATVAVSLLHLHHNRAHGLDSDAEARTHHLARAVALAYAARCAALAGGL